YIHVVQHTPTKKQFKHILDKTPLNINNFFNTHPIKYPQLNLKHKLKNISDDQKLQLLPSHPMLLKPPLAISRN
ncbi:thioredoxin domain-containing protein, partial [Staphylococcus epidermidis]